MTNPKLIKFYAPWCQPCRIYGRTFHKFTSDHADILTEEINIDENPEAAARFGVTKLPTTVLLDGETVVDKREGALIYRQLQQMVGA